VTRQQALLYLEAVGGDEAEALLRTVRGGPACVGIPLATRIRELLNESGVRTTPA